MDTIYITVIACFTSFLLGLAFGFPFVIARHGKRMFEESVN